MAKENTYCRNYEADCSCHNCENHKVTWPMGDLKCKLKNHYVDHSGVLTCDDYKAGQS